MKFKEIPKCLQVHPYVTLAATLSLSVLVAIVCAIIGIELLVPIFLIGDIMTVGILSVTSDILKGAFKFYKLHRFVNQRKRKLTQAIIAGHHNTVREKLNTIVHKILNAKRISPDKKMDLLAISDSNQYTLLLRAVHASADDIVREILNTIALSLEQSLFY